MAVNQNKVDRVKKVYLDLNSEEQELLKKFIKEYDRKPFNERTIIDDNLRKSLGPMLTTGCPYCGK